MRNGRSSAPFSARWATRAHIAYLLVPLAEVEIVDDWQVLGLAGTGSKSLVLRDVFVPEHRCVMVSDLFAGTPPGALVHPDYPVLRAPRGFLVSYSLPPVRDRARPPRARPRLPRRCRRRVSRGVTRLADSEVVQMAIGEAAAAIDAATLLLHTGRDSSTAAVSSGRRITEAEALRARRDMVYAQHQVGWALERLCELSGARWVYDSDPLQEIRRDVMTILTHHAASRPAAFAPYGHMLLGTGAEAISVGALGLAANAHLSVIPGPSPWVRPSAGPRINSARNPEPREHGRCQMGRGRCSWVPGSALRAAPE